MLEVPNHTQISNIIIDHYMPLLKGSEFKVVVAIARKTIGWHKNKEKVSLSVLEKMTGLSRQGVATAVKRLEEDKVIDVYRDGPINIYEINYSGSQISGLVKKVDQTSQKTLPSASQKSRHIKDILIKETIKKENLPTDRKDAEYFYENVRIHALLSALDRDEYPDHEFFNEGYENYKSYRTAIWLFRKITNHGKDVNLTMRKCKLKDWADEIRLCVDENKTTHQDLVKLIVDALKDDFWSIKLKSAGRLRKSYDNIVDSLELNKVKKSKTETNTVVANAGAYAKYTD